MAMQIKRFAAAIFEPNDLVEIRALPGGAQRWVHASELAELSNELAEENGAGRNIYFGANPRQHKGGRAEDVALARCLFADFDGVDLDEVRRRIDEAILPAPTVLVRSGHGVHAYWRLDEPMTDLAVWTTRQRALIENAGSDPAIHDPPRIMRLPGLMNLKRDPHVPCELVEADPQRVYAIDEFPEPEPVQVRSADPISGNGRLIPEGRRNSELTSIAGSLRRRGLLEAEIRGALLEVNRGRCRPSLDVREVETIARSVARYPAGNDLHLTEQGNAERLVQRHGDIIRYCDAWGCWLVWDGRRWAVDEVRRVEALATDTVRSIYADAAAESDKKKRERIAAWAKTSESRHHAMAMIDLAKHRLPVKPGQLDADPWLMNCANGVLDLPTGGLGPHDPKQFHTKIAPVHVDPEAQCPTFDRFLKETTCDNEHLAAYIQQMLGMCLTGDVSEQILSVWWGTGSNGKNTLYELILYIVGDYAGLAAPELLVARQWTQHPTEIADLRGRRLVVASETEKNQRLRVQFVKQVTGDGRLKGRFMRQDFFEFDRQFKLILVTNNRPIVDEQTHAIWRRLKLVPFLNTVPDECQDKTLPAKLKAEAPGVLAWMVRGCLSWQQQGLQTPAEVVEATDEYRGASDALGRFVGECLTFLPEAWTRSSELAGELDRWAKDNGVELTVCELHTRLQLEGCEPSRRQQRRGWCGVGIVSQREEVPD